MTWDNQRDSKMRKTEFFDIPVHENTRKKLKEYKKTKKCKSYDQVINNILKNIQDFDMGGM